MELLTKTCHNKVVSRMGPAIKRKKSQIRLKNATTVFCFIEMRINKGLRSGCK